MWKLDSVFLKIWQFLPHPFNCKKVRGVQLSSNFLLLLSPIAIVITLMCEIWTRFLKNIHQKWEYYREEKQDFERLLIFLNRKMLAKSNKIELSEEFMAMWREEETLWNVMFPLYPDKNEKDNSLKRMSDKFQIFLDWYFWITFCFKCKIFFQLTSEVLKFQLCF